MYFFYFLTFLFSFLLAPIGNSNTWSYDAIDNLTKHRNIPQKTSATVDDFNTVRNLYGPSSSSSSTAAVAVPTGTIKLKKKKKDGQALALLEADRRLRALSTPTFSSAAKFVRPSSATTYEELEKYNATKEKTKKVAKLNTTASASTSSGAGGNGASKSISKSTRNSTNSLGGRKVR